MSQSLSSPDWLEEGSDKLGTRVRRAILSEDGETVMGYGDGTVVGWLPTHLSDFFSEFTQEPAPLWHIKYDSAELGEEDLEEVEVEDAAEAFQKDAWCNSDKAREASEFLRKKKLALAEKVTADEGSAQFPPAEHASGSNSAPGIRGKGAKFEVGEKVEARFSNGDWYQAMIAEALILKSILYSYFSAAKRISALTYGNVFRVLENGFFVVTWLDDDEREKIINFFFVFQVLENGFFLVTWHDHDERERVKTPSDVRKVSEVDVQGLRRVGLPAAPRDLGQDSEQRARRSLGAGNRCEADKGGGSRCIYRMYTQTHTHTRTNTRISLSRLNRCVFLYMSDRHDDVI
jgi:hypothetical protein